MPRLLAFLAEVVLQPEGQQQVQRWWRCFLPPVHFLPVYHDIFHVAQPCLFQHVHAKEGKGPREVGIVQRIGHETSYATGCQLPAVAGPPQAFHDTTEDPLLRQQPAQQFRHCLFKGRRHGHEPAAELGHRFHIRHGHAPVAVLYPPSHL